MPHQLTDWHAHCCKRCDTVWEHDREAIPDDRYDEAHACPRCGTEQTFRYSGNAVATHCHNGARTLDYGNPATPRTRSGTYPRQPTLSLFEMLEMIEMMSDDRHSSRDDIRWDDCD